MTESPSMATFLSRADLNKYASNALLLFALELAFSIEDIDATASLSLTDGSDDKKCDLVYVDRDSGRVVIAQSYLSEKERPAAPSNKAADLNTAIAWLLGSDPSSLPEGLKPARAELDSALLDGTIRTLELWYVHNLPESTNVQDELEIVRGSADAQLRRHYSDVTSVDAVVVREVGRTTLEKWYSSSQVPILVTDDFQVEVKGGFEESGDLWEAYCTAVPASWLRETFEKHQTDLFSANVRDYLGSINSDANINNNIKQTAKDRPHRFFAYNNGLTAIVNGFEPPEPGSSILTIHGMSIVNGAQTTGAIASSEATHEALSTAHVLARFVKCSDQTVIRSIIEFNNSQNKVEAADFRSNDETQDRLRDEFSGIPDAEYRGGRRGSERDVIERPPNLISTRVLAQALSAFHGQPNTAYNETKRIWSSDEVYSQVFPEQVTARHALLCYSLFKAIEDEKFELMSIAIEDRTEAQTNQVAFYRKRGSSLLLTAAVSSCMETVLGTPIRDSWRLRFKENLAPKDAIAAWKGIIGQMLAFTPQLDSALETNLKNRDRVADAIAKFASLVGATKEALGDAAFAGIGDQIEVSR